MIVPAPGDPPPPAVLAEAAEIISRGQVLAIPTDTVYGLVADPRQALAVNRLFHAKRRPGSLSLPVLVAGATQVLDLLADVPPAAHDLMDRFWPGPLTIVLSCRDDVGRPGLAPGVCGKTPEGRDTVAVRHPDHPVPLGLCRLAGPLASTSANLHGEATPPTATAVADVFGDTLAMVLDGGMCGGQPSAVVDCTRTEPRLLRPGAIDWSEIRAAFR